jgi:hypothetical protein
MKETEEVGLPLVGEWFLLGRKGAPLGSGSEHAHLLRLSGLLISYDKSKFQKDGISGLH